MKERITQVTTARQLCKTALNRPVGPPYGSTISWSPRARPEMPRNISARILRARNKTSRSNSSLHKYSRLKAGGRCSRSKAQRHCEAAPE